MYKTRVTFEIDYSGQRRAYADTTTEGKLIVECQSDMFPGWHKQPINSEQAKRMLKEFFLFVEEGEGDPFSPVLKTFRESAPGEWQVLIVSRYDD